MRTTKSNDDAPWLVLLFGAAATLATLGCGKTGIAVGGTGGKGSTASGGSIDQGGAVSLGGSIDQGGAVSLGGSIDQGGAVSLGGSLGQGGVTASAGNTGRGGAVSSGGTISQGGRTATGGSGGTQTATSVSPRQPSAHRPQAASCVGVHSPSEPVNPQYGDCKKHADCTNGTSGKCIHGIASAGQLYYCVYDQCAGDSDCDTGKVCYCTASSAARCLSLGNCRIDADCGGGDYSYCSPSNGWDCGGYRNIDSYYCHTPKDSCMDDRDCTGTNYCNYDVIDGRWKCTAPNMSCVIG